MGFIKKTEVKTELTVSVPQGSENDVKILLSNLNAKEIELLRKVSEKPTLKALALNAAKSMFN